MILLGHVIRIYPLPIPLPSELLFECSYAFLNFLGPSQVLLTDIYFHYVKDYFLLFFLPWFWCSDLGIPSIQFSFQVLGSVLFAMSLLLIRLATWIVGVFDHLKMRCSCTSDCMTADVEVQHSITVRSSDDFLGSSLNSSRISARHSNHF